MVLHTNDCIPPGLFGHSLQALKSNYTRMLNYAGPSTHIDQLSMQ